MTGEILTFVKARLAEEFVRAHAAKQGTWTADFHPQHGWRILDGPAWQTATLVAWSPGPSAIGEHTAAYIAANQPSMTLRRCEVLERVIAECERGQGSVARYPNPANAAALIVHQTMLRLVAGSWDKHPDYEQEWAVPDLREHPLEREEESGGSN